MRKTVGIFEVCVSTLYPIYITLSVGEESIKCTHRDLADLKHAVIEAEKAAKRELQEKYRDEV